MSNKYIVVILLALSVSACAKKKGDKKTSGGNFVLHEYSVNGNEPKCVEFKKGQRLKKIEITNAFLNGVEVHTKSYGQGNPVSVANKHGLLLTFDSNKTYLLVVEGSSAALSYTPTKAELESARRDLMLIAKASKVTIAACEPSTKYTTTGDLSSLRFISRRSFEKPAENNESDIDGIITIGDVEL
ncbi:MAG: hypothetical protein AB7H97_20340 [Pseudobdellovibrionaceae bacterium]